MEKDYILSKQCKIKFYIKNSFLSKVLTQKKEVSDKTQQTHRLIKKNHSIGGKY